MALPVSLILPQWHSEHLLTLIGSHLLAALVARTTHSWILFGSNCGRIIAHALSAQWASDPFHGISSYTVGIVNTFAWDLGKQFPFTTGNARQNGQRNFIHSYERKKDRSALSVLQCSIYPSKVRIQLSCSLYILPGLQLCHWQWLGGHAWQCWYLWIPMIFLLRWNYNTCVHPKEKKRKK